MEYRSLGRTGARVSPLCLGTMNFGYRTPENVGIEMIHQALDDGVNFIDTANFYGQPLKDGRGQGNTEKIVGKALAGRREKVILATKVYMPTADYPDDPNAFGISRRHIIAECEASLKRLNTDYIDLYQLHHLQREIPIDETLRALDDLVRSGKVRYIGTSKYLAWHLLESLWISEKLHLNRFVTEQPKYHMLNRAIERELVPMAQEYGIAILPYSPLGGGILTGKYKRGEAFPEDSRMNDEVWGDWAHSYWRDNTYDVLDLLTEMAVEKDCTISQLVLAWTMHQPGMTSVIIGPRTISQYQDNLGALDVEITDEDRQRIDAVTAHWR